MPDRPSPARRPAAEPLPEGWQQRLLARLAGAEAELRTRFDRSEKNKLQWRLEKAGVDQGADLGWGALWLDANYARACAELRALRAELSRPYREPPPAAERGPGVHVMRFVDSEPIELFLSFADYPELAAADRECRSIRRSLDEVVARGPADDVAARTGAALPFAPPALRTTQRTFEEIRAKAARR